MKNNNFRNFEKPRGWEGMEIVDRLGWLRRSGVAGDLLEAMELLKAAGEWPSEEALGMAGGKGLSRMTRADYARRAHREAAPVSEGRLPRGEGPRRGSRAWKAGGRRDRLAKHY